MTKIIPKIKKIGGGLLALGIFLFLATFGNNDLVAYFAKLKADVFGAMPIITSIYPDSGAVGDLIYVEGNDLGETIEENILRFGDVEAVVASVGLDSNGGIRIIATVPELPAGEYSIELETPIGNAFNADTSDVFTVLDGSENEVISRGTTEPTPREITEVAETIEELIIEKEDENLKPARRNGGRGTFGGNSKKTGREK